MRYGMALHLAGVLLCRHGGLSGTSRRPLAGSLITRVIDVQFFTAPALTLRVRDQAVVVAKTLAFSPLKVTIPEVSWLFSIGARGSRS